jgi:hypothetical protein
MKLMMIQPLMLPLQAMQINMQGHILEGRGIRNQQPFVHFGEWVFLVGK